MNKGIAGVIVVVLIIAGIWAATRHHTANHTAVNKPASTNQTVVNSASNATAPTTETMITYNGSSFSPASITVKSGTTVTIKNTSNQSLQFDSDPHPIHTDDTDLNVGIVNPGQSLTFTANKKGSFGYHNHLDPSQTGSITVQ